MTGSTKNTDAYIKNLKKNQDYTYVRLKTICSYFYFLNERLGAKKIHSYISYLHKQHL